MNLKHSLQAILLGLSFTTLSATTPKEQPLTHDEVVAFAQAHGCTVNDGVLTIPSATHLTFFASLEMGISVALCIVAAKLMHSVNGWGSEWTPNPTVAKTINGSLLTIATAAILYSFVTFLNSYPLTKCDKRPLFTLDKDGITYFKRTGILQGIASTIKAEKVAWKDIREVTTRDVMEPNHGITQKPTDRAQRALMRLLITMIFGTDYRITVYNNNGKRVIKIEDSRDLPIKTIHFAEIIEHYRNSQIVA